MTKKQCQKLLRKETVPVIWGNSASAHRLACFLRLRYGLSSVLCAPNRNFRDYLNPFVEFFPTVFSSSRLRCEQLCALAERYEDCLMLLFLPEQDVRSLSDTERELLESRYILAESQMLPERLPACLLPLRLRTWEERRVL